MYAALMAFADSPARDSGLPASTAPTVGAVVNAVALLRALGAEGPSGVNALARVTGVSPSSCFNILRTLVQQGLVDFDPLTKNYALGLGTADLARAALRGDDMIGRAGPAMQRLAESVDAAVGLWRLASADRLVLVALAESEAATRIHMVIGQRQPVGAGAAGRAMLAASEADAGVVARAYAALRWQRPVSLERFQTEIAQARRRGFAIDLGRMHGGIVTAAAAIPEPAGAAPRYCLSASMFIGQHPRADLPRIGAEVAATAQRLTRR